MTRTFAESFIDNAGLRTVTLALLNKGANKFRLIFSATGPARGTRLYAVTWRRRRSQRRIRALMRWDITGAAPGRQIGSEYVITPDKCPGQSTASCLACSGQGSSVRVSGSSARSMGAATRAATEACHRRRSDSAADQRQSPPSTRSEGVRIEGIKGCSLLAILWGSPDCCATWCLGSCGRALTHLPGCDALHRC